MLTSKYKPILIVCAATLTLLGCSISGDDLQSGFRLIVFLDQTASINAAQRNAWLKEAGSLASRLAGGSSVVIYPIHDQTMDAAPLFEAEIPERKDDATSDEALAEHTALIRAREGARDAIEKGLNAGSASRTDVFSSIDRVQPDSRERRTVIVYFSDMLNSTPDFNMEIPGAIKRSEIASDIQKITLRHNWQPDQLAGDEIYCVLNSIESGHKGPPVDRLTQRVFYGALFQALGARVMHYEPHLTVSILDSAISGGHNVESH